LQSYLLKVEHISRHDSAAIDILISVSARVFCAQYQEEVIDDMWSSFTRQKGLLEERDETITSLYERLDAAEKAAKRGPITSISHPVRFASPAASPELHERGFFTWF
jgi:hypothetical protein